MGAQIKAKQVAGLQATLNALTGIDTIVESFSTNQTDGATGITITYSARERDAVQIFVNGARVSDGYSWSYNNATVTADSLEVGSELVWDSNTTGFLLEATDVIQIQYETEAGGSVGSGGAGGGTSGTSGTSGVSGSGSMGGTMTSSIIPDTNAQYDLGSAEYKIRHLYLSDNSLYLGDSAQITMQGGKLQLPQTQIGGADGIDLSTPEEFAKAQRLKEGQRMINLYNNRLQYACSPVWLEKTTGEGSYVGSGQWVSLAQDSEGQPTDLNDGWFLTCAHNIMEVSGGVHRLFDRIYIGLNGEWYLVDQSWVIYDAVADIALLRTGLTLTADKVLTLAPPAKDPVTGQEVWMCGFPGGYDTDSLTSGIIRDAHFNISDGGQAVDSLFIDAPGIGGNSGSAMLNNEGEIIGLFTFGFNNKENFGGGVNIQTMRLALEKMAPTIQSNPGYMAWQDKLYLGVDWGRVSPISWAAKYPAGVTDGVGGPVIMSKPQAKGCEITQLDGTYTALGGVQLGEVWLSATIGTGQQFDFGYEHGHITPGVMMHLDSNPVTLEYIDPNGAKLQRQLIFDTFGQHAPEHDNYLTGGTIISAQAKRVD
jgi:hypothetical protein